MKTVNKNQYINNQSRSSRRLRVLISAYSCEPYRGSEPAIGWNISLKMSEYHDVWVLTRSNNKTVINQYLSNNPQKGLYFIYHDLPNWLSFWKSKGRGVNLYYYLWQLTSIPKILKKNLEIHFHLSHHVTFCRYWSPSCLAFLPIPFIWGPVGGGELTPKSLFRTLSFKERLYEILKFLVLKMSELDPFVIKTAKKASLVYATTRDTAKRIKNMNVKNIECLTQVGIDDLGIESNNFNNEVCRFVSMGRMIHWKGFLLGLEAFSNVSIENVEFWFIGDGVCRKSLEEFTQKNNLSTKVKFLGELSNEETIKHLKLCDVLVHPSYHDSGGLVCLEAMSLAKPVICLDTGGPAVFINSDCGFPIRTETQKETLKLITDAMYILSTNKELRLKMGQNAKVRVQNHFLWNTKVKNYSDKYLELIEQNNIKKNYYTENT